MKVFRFKKQKLGKVFGDFLEKRGRIVGRRRKERRRGIGPAGSIGLIGLILLFSLLFGRLFWLTVVRGGYYRDLAENNRVREERIAAPRGVIYDRNKKVLARNRPVYKKCQTSGVKCQVLSREEALRREAKGEEVKVELSREYPQGAAAAHVVGYMGEITNEKLKIKNEKCNNCYQAGDQIGLTGAEEAFEKVLRGRPGKRLVEVDSQEREIRELARIKPVVGENIYLSIDFNLQKVIAEAFKGQSFEFERVSPLKGAVVVSNPWTGELLALYSSPSFDPNMFVNQELSRREIFSGVNSRRLSAGLKQSLHSKISSSSSSLQEILNDPKKPLFNRAIAGLYPPGSTFKIIVAAAGLESGVIDEKTKVEDTGIINIGPYRFPNWYFSQYGKKEGTVDIVKAIQRSNDIFFYKVGEWVGADRLEEWAKKFSLNTKLGIEINGEARGIVRRPRKWYLGDTYHLAIGQGDLLVTPLQVNAWTEAIANKGKLCKPTVVKAQTNPNSQIQNFKQNCRKLPLSKKTVALITEGMRRACAPGGTGWPLFKFKVKNAKLKIDGKNFLAAEKGGWVKIPVACKTGTAEYGDPQRKTHAWLTAFAPVDKPEIVVTVLVEGGGEGSSVAGPIVKKVLEEWFQK